MIAGWIFDVASARNVSREVATVGDGDSYICFIVQDQDWQPELRQDGANVDQRVAFNHCLIAAGTDDEPFALGPELNRFGIAR